MYNMYPNYAQAPKERGEGGLGHYDYPVYETSIAGEDTPHEKSTEPVSPTPEAEKALGYVSVNEMVVD